MTKRRASRTEQVREKASVQRWLRGHVVAGLRSRQAVAEEGSNPTQAAAEALSAVNALAAMKLWPGPRDPANEAAVLEVRKRWVRIQQRARRGRTG